MPAVSVLIVNYNAGPYLAACLSALARQSLADFEAIVLDNGSTDDSFAQAQAAIAGDARFRLQAMGRNLGFAAGNNHAASLAQAPWLALLNPDAFAEPDWLAELLAATQRHPDVAMFGSQQIDARDPARLDGAGDRYFAAGFAWRGGYGWPADTALREGEVFSPCAAAALYRADAFRAAGGFDEDFFCYVEDVDLAFRLRLMGQRTIQIVSAKVRHLGSATSGGKDSPFARYHGMRNSLWCFTKNMPGPLFWPLLPLCCCALLYLWLRNIQKGTALQFWQGIRDALRGLPGAWAKRRRIQATRIASASAIAVTLTWNPFEYMRRAPANRH